MPNSCRGCVNSVEEINSMANCIYWGDRSTVGKCICGGQDSQQSDSGQMHGCCNWRVIPRFECRQLIALGDGLELKVGYNERCVL